MKLIHVNKKGPRNMARYINTMTLFLWYLYFLSWFISNFQNITWLRHQMKTFSVYWPFVWGIHRSPVNSPHKGQWRGALMFSFICAWINDWVNNHEADDLRRHRAHYDVIVMTWINFIGLLLYCMRAKWVFITLIPYSLKHYISSRSIIWNLTGFDAKQCQNCITFQI